jgi:hypothetical protein
MSDKQFISNLSSTYADVRKLDVKKINLKGKNILEYIKENTTVILDERGTLANDELDIWNSYVTKDEDGNDVYPEIWIKHSIVGFVPYTPDKDMFKYHKPEKVIDYDQETGEVKDEDPETQSFTDGE